MYSGVNPLTPPRQDSLNRQINIDSIHDKIHNGEIFHSFGEFTLALAGTQVLHFKTGTKEAHIYGTIASSDIGTLKLYKDAVIDGANDGTPVTVFNRKMSLPDNTSISKLYATPTTTSAGTQFDTYLLGGNKKAGGEGRNENEWVFKPNTSYLMIITSGAADNSIVARIQWYEV